MKRILAGILCVAMCFQMAACGVAKDDKKWIEEGTAKLGTDLRSGEFVLDGEVYSFPMELSVWLDRGWHVSNNYENKDEFTLEPGGESTEFELFNEDKKYVRVSVFNVSQEEAKVEQCLVSSLYISLSDFEIVFPGGINTSNKPAEIKEAYGTPDEEGTETGSFKGIYYYTSEDGWACSAEVHAMDNDYTINPFTSIEYVITNDGSNWDRFLTTIGGGGQEACINYIEAAMEASFLGEFDDYVLYYDTEENAQMLYESEMAYFAVSLMYYAGIDYDYVEDAITLAFDDVAKQVLANTKWEVSVTDFDEEQMTGTIEMTLYPTDFFTIISDDIDAAIVELQTKYADVDFNNCSDSKYTEIMRDYAQMVLDVVSARAAEAQTAEPVTKSYSIDFNNGVLSDEDWAEIDDIIMGIAE